MTNRAECWRILLPSLWMLSANTLAACRPISLSKPTLAQSTVPVDTRCPGIRILAPESEEGQSVLRTLSLQLPPRLSPDVQTAWPISYDSVLSILASNDWVLVQASFVSHLEPAIFLLRRDQSNLVYDGLAWAGQADSAQAIKDYLRSQAPEAPTELFLCLEPAAWFLP